jgi:hypothetical protein
MERHLQLAAEHGRIHGATADNVLELAAIAVQPPTIIARNRIQEAQADEIYNRIGVASQETIGEKAGFDPDVEQARLRKNPTLVMQQAKVTMDVAKAGLKAAATGGAGALDNKRSHQSVQRGQAAGRAVPANNETGPDANPQRAEESLATEPEGELLVEDVLLVEACDESHIIDNMPDIRQTDHYSCFLPGQELQGRVIGASKAWYTGKAIKIRTISGSVLSVTPNHPVLTKVGFIPAGQLKEGDRLVKYIGEDQTASSCNDKQHAPSIVEEVFRSLKNISGIIAPKQEATTSAFDFHGDAERFQGNIEVVGSYSQLPSNGISEFSEAASESNLVIGGSPASSLERSGSFKPRVDRTDASFVGDVAGGNLSATQAIVHPIPDSLSRGRQCSANFGTPHSQECRFGGGANLDISIFECSTQNVSTKAVTVSNLSHSLTSHIPNNSLVCGDERGIGLACENGSATLPNDTPLPQLPTKSITADAILVAQLFDRFTSQVTLDEIVEINHFDYSGFVYDFESPLGYVIVGSIVNSNCGAACAMVCGKHFGVGPDDLEAWKKELGTTEENSTHPHAIATYLTKLGLRVETKSHATISQMAAAIKQGAPVITVVQDYGNVLSPKANYSGHYLTVIGIVGDRPRRYIICQDSSGENADHVPGGDVPSKDANNTSDIAELGKIMVAEEKWNSVWHDEANGVKYIRYIIIVRKAPKEAVAEPDVGSGS